MYFFPSRANIRLVCVFIPISLLMVLYGCSVGWVASSIVYLQRNDSHIPLSVYEATLIPGLAEVGRVVSAIPAGMLGDKIGRKGVIYLCIAQHFLAWILKAFTTSKLLLFIARFLCGTAIGTGNAVLFIYAGEISPPKIRGTVLSILYSGYYLGIFIQYVLGTFLNYNDICFVTLTICGLFFSFSFFIKESPSYLLTKSQETEALQIYKWLQPDSSEEVLCKKFDSLKEYISNQSKSRTSMFSGFSNPLNRKCVALVFNINLLTQLTGQPAVIAFSQVIFQNVNILTPALFSVICAAAQFLAGCFSTVLADVLGRRTMYKVAGGLCAVSHIATTILYTFSDTIPHAYWLLLASISCYTCVYAAGLGPLTVIVRGELLPQSVKGIGSGLAVVSAGISCFLLVYIFKFIEQYLGMAYNFVFFALTTVLLMVLVHLKLPETKGKTLEEIQNILERS